MKNHMILDFQNMDLQLVLKWALISPFKREWGAWWAVVQDNMWLMECAPMNMVEENWENSIYI
jgi:hypothetical protein